MEHTSHHPPVSHFHMHPKDQGYQFWGYYEFTGKMGGNSLKSGLRGPNNIRFSDGQHIRFRVPDFKLGGTVMGDRTIEATGSISFEDITNNLKAVVIFSTYKKSGFWKKKESGKRDEYTGIIYQCEPIKNPDQSGKEIFSKNAVDIDDLSKIKDNVKTICKIEGSFLRECVIGGKKYWDIDRDIPNRF